MSKYFPNIKKRIISFYSDSSIDAQRAGLNKLENMVKNNNENWNCSICGKEVIAKDYPKHYFGCKMKNELNKRGIA